MLREGHTPARANSWNTVKRPGSQVLQREVGEQGSSPTATSPTAHATTGTLQMSHSPTISSTIWEITTVPKVLKKKNPKELWPLLFDHDVCCFHVQVDSSWFLSPSTDREVVTARAWGCVHVTELRRGQVVCLEDGGTLQLLSQVPGLCLLRDIYKAWIPWSNTDESVCGGGAGCRVGRWGGGGCTAFCRCGWRLGVWHGQRHGPGHRWWRRRRQHRGGEEWVVHLALTASVGIEEPHLSSLLTSIGADKLDKLLQRLLRVVTDGWVWEIRPRLLDDRWRWKVESRWRRMWTCSRSCYDRSVMLSERCPQGGGLRRGGAAETRLLRLLQSGWRWHAWLYFMPSAGLAATPWRAPLACVKRFFTRTVHFVLHRLEALCRAGRGRAG